MSDTPKFEVIDRRKYKAEEEEREAAQTPAPVAAPAAVPAPGPAKADPREEPRVGPQLVTESGREDVLPADELDMDQELPPAPTAEETREQKFAYDASAQRLEDLVRAQNPGAGPQPVVTFEHLVNQFYVSAMIQMGAGTQEGQRPRVDILGAKQTIDLMGVLAEKTKGNLNETEDRTLQAVLYEVRMAFLELTNMISLQSMQPPAPPPGKR
jgi:hypothetical protein